MLDGFAKVGGVLVGVVDDLRGFGAGGKVFPGRGRERVQIAYHHIEIILEKGLDIIFSCNSRTIENSKRALPYEGAGRPLVIPAGLQQAIRTTIRRNLERCFQNVTSVNCQATSVVFSSLDSGTLHTLTPQCLQGLKVSERLVENDEGKTGCRALSIGPGSEHAGRVPFCRVTNHRLAYTGMEWGRGRGRGRGNCRWFWLAD